MRKFYTRILFSIILGAFTTGCSTIASSTQYTMGTECLNEHDFQGAIEHLEKAVKLDPSMSKNLSNLAAAHFAAGHVDQAWYYYRKSVLCKHTDRISLTMFLRVADVLIAKQALNEPGVPLEEILAKLGNPDIFEREGNGRAQLTYGLVKMKFFEEKLVDCLILKPS